MSKSILVATIGTRDLMFQTSSGDWYNVGDDRMQNGKIIGEQLEVISDLGLDETKYLMFRELTQYFLENMETYSEKIRPVILGKLLDDTISELETVYLVITDQKEEVKQREKDTIYAGEILKQYLKKLKPDLQVELILLGQDGTNPSNFEQMFGWWKKVWKETINPQSNQSILVCLKGGVGQASEASRISGLSLYGEQVKFYEFTQNPKSNRQGIASDYSGPFLGANYLWDRTQKEALKLLERYDYAGLLEILRPYFQQNPHAWSNIPDLVKAGLNWNQGEFDTFFSLAKSGLDQQRQRQQQEYWWMAYEQAYTAVVRLKQNYTTEAMLQSFRAIEGLITEWVRAKFSSHIEDKGNQYPKLKSSICSTFPTLQSEFKSSQKSIRLEGRIQQKLVELDIPQADKSQDFQAWGSLQARNARNRLSHRLGGISKKEVFEAWGKDIKDEEAWKKRILNCLNLITGNTFGSLEQASLFACIHHQVKEGVANIALRAIGSVD